MRARIVKIGNSQGIRIPKPILEQIGAGEDVELAVEDRQIVIRPSANPREGWDEAFKRMAESGDDSLLIGGDEPIGHSWDDEEWRW
jgi:antitoxin MazE